MTAGPLASAQIRGIAAMILAATLLSGNDAVSKYLSETYPVGQILCLRHLWALLLIAAYVHWRAGWHALRVVDRGGQALRAFFFVCTTGLIVLSLSMLPLATVTAIAFSSPVFVVLFSGPMLGERIGPRRWAAALLGFAGVLIIIRPGTADFSWLLVLPTLSAMTGGLRDGITRNLSRTETSLSVLFWSQALVIVLSAATVVSGWQPVSLASMGWFALNGAFSAGAHFLMIDALRLGEASLVSPFRYTGIIWAAIIGLLVWGHVPDAWTLIGSAVIISSGVYIIERESRP